MDVQGLKKTINGSLDRAAVSAEKETAAPTTTLVAAAAVGKARLVQN